MNTNLKNFLTGFFIYNEKSRNRIRPYKWERIKEDLELINSLNPNLVLDLGCGDNRYKPLVKNLIGIDIAYDPRADIISDITTLDFEDNSVDAIIAYGSINFGDEELIIKQLTEAKRVLKDKGIICIRAYSKPKLEFNAIPAPPVTINAPVELFVEIVELLIVTVSNCPIGSVIDIVPDIVPDKFLYVIVSGVVSGTFQLVCQMFCLELCRHYFRLCA